MGTVAETEPVVQHPNDKLMKAHLFLNQFCLLLVILAGMSKSATAQAQGPYQKYAL
jgi:hypothetical protein